MLNSLEIPLDKLVGVGVDGGPSLVGPTSGLGAKLRQLMTGSILSINCAAPRTALVNLRVTGSSPEMLNLDRVLKAVHVSFSGLSGERAKQWAKYARKNYATNCVLPEFGSPTWFSRAECASVLVNVLPQLINFLDRSVKKKAEGWEACAELREELTDVTFVATLCLVADVLQPLETFRKVFEDDEIAPHHVPVHLKECLESLRSIRGEGSGTRVWGKLPWFFRELSPSNVWGTLRGKIQLHGEVCRDEFRPFAACVVFKVEEFLKMRFPDTYILSCFEIFHPAFYADTNLSKDLASLGHAQLKDILMHFCHKKLRQPVFEMSPDLLEDLKAEFKKMKLYLWDCTYEYRQRKQDRWCPSVLPLLPLPTMKKKKKKI